MSFNRREFHVLLAGLLTRMGSNAAGQGSASDSALDSEAFGRQCLNRLTFGANQAALERFQELGLTGWLDWQLGLPVTDRALDQRLAEARLAIEYPAGKEGNGGSWKAVAEERPYRYLKAKPIELLPLTDYSRTALHFEERYRPAREVQAASLIRAVHAEAQLREMMTAFWHEHFSVQSTQNQHTAAYLGLHDRLLREHALGNIRQMLGLVVRSPAMLFFLNNEASKASPANENFARELFELHTLGAENYANGAYARWSEVPGAQAGEAQAYIDEDVYEAARALTGWSFGDGRYIADGDSAPLSGDFFYIEAWHDPYQKRILGAEFPPNSAPMEDGERLLDLLANHPGTARFICRKLIRRFLADQPPEELVESLAGVFRAHSAAPDQMARVLRQLVLSPHFARWQPQKLKRPFELLASYYRAVGAEVRSPSLNFHWALARTGWLQHERRPPTGHADFNAHWANTNYLAGCTEILLQAFEPWFEITEHDLLRHIPGQVTRLDQAAQHYAGLLLGGGDHGALGQRIASAFEDLGGHDLDRDEGTRRIQLTTVLALVALQPGFLLR
jgi:uncharacterized protein (DUF1800 family)